MLCQDAIVKVIDLIFSCCEMKSMKTYKYSFSEPLNYYTTACLQLYLTCFCNSLCRASTRYCVAISTQRNASDNNLA